MNKQKQFINMIKSAENIAIVGHIHPDGDCIGSNLAMFNYITENFKGKNVDVYDETCPASFKILPGYRKIKHEDVGKRYDLAISIDVSNVERLGKFQDIFNSAISTICIDHHVSNKGFADFCYIVPDASSACEVMCDLLDMDKISEKTANCLYLGIVHDTGVFKYSATSRKTMELAGFLLEKGAKSEVIIDETFYKKTYKQNLLMARALLEAELMDEGKIIYCYLSKDIFKEYKCTSLDVDGIVEQLRLTDGVEVAILCYQLTKKSYKFSFRSKSYVDVNEIASTFGGGGHIRAAGLTVEGKLDKIVPEVIKLTESKVSG